MFLKNLPLVFLMIVFSLIFSLCRITDNIARSSPSIDKPSDGLEKKRAILTDKADDYLGKKYKYAGKTPKSGFDCSGYTYYLMKQVDVSIPASSAAQAKVGQKISLKKAQAGDLVFFKKGKSGRVFHVAMVYSNTENDLQIIHSTSSRGVVIDHLYSSKYWNPKISHASNVLTKNVP